MPTIVRRVLRVAVALSVVLPGLFVRAVEATAGPPPAANAWPAPGQQEPVAAWEAPDADPVESGEPSGRAWGVARAPLEAAEDCMDLPAETWAICSLLGPRLARSWSPFGGEFGGVGEAGEVGALGDDSGGLIGGNLPICAYADDVSSTESLDRSSVAYNPNTSQYLVVWHGVARATSYDIFARFVSTSGTVSGGVLALNQDAGLQIAPSVAYEPSANQYWVTWSDFGLGNTGTVRLRRFSAAGAPLGGVITVSSAGTNAFASRVTCGGGRCIVTWTNSVSSGVAQILARGYDASGNAATSAVLLSDSNGFADSPDIAFDPVAGYFLVVWEQAVNGWWNVLGVGLNAALQLLPRVTFTAGSWGERYPRVAFNAPSLNYLVVWDDGRNGQTTPDIYGQLVGSGFGLASSSLTIYAGPHTDWAPAVASLDTSSQFLVAYQTDTNGGGLLQMHACVVSGTGSVGSQFVVREWNNDRTNPAVAARSGSTSYLVTFTDDSMLTQPDIFAQAVTSGGQLSGSLVTVVRGRKGQERPAVACATNHGEYLATWMDYRGGSDYQIYARRVSSSGQLQGTELVIPTQTGSILRAYPAVAYNATNGEYLVAWQEITSQSSGYDICARRVRWDGTFQGSQFVVSRDSNSGDEGSPRVAYNSSANEYLVTWNAYDASGRWRVWGQRVSAGGALTGAGFVISASSGDCGPPRLAYNPTGNQYLVIWEDLRNGNDSVYDQLVNANGTLSGSNYAVTTASGSKRGYSVAYGSAGNDYLAVWGDSQSGSAVYGQHMNSGAAWVGAAFPIANSGAGEGWPAVAYDAKNHDFLVSWQQTGASSDIDVWARRVPESGSPSNGGFAVATANDIQDYTELAQDPSSGQFLLVWQDFRSGSYDVYGQRWAQSNCAFSISQTSGSFVAAGGTGSVNVTLTAGSNCSWTATSTAAWITITGGASGTNNGTVSYSVAANAGAARSGTLTIAGQTFTVNQAAAACTYSLSASSASVPAGGGSGSFTVTAASWCAWTATAGAAWIHVTGGASGTGNGTVSYSADANTGSARTGAITAGGQTFTLNQAAGGTTASYSHWLPAVIHKDVPSRNAKWRSDIAVINRSSHAASIEVRVYSPVGVLSAAFAVGGNAQLFLPDVVGQLSYAGDAGALEVRSDQDVFLTGRTYNQVDVTHTYGQDYDGQSSEALLAAGQSAWLPQLAQTALYRTNIGITNTGATTASVTVTLFSGQGVQLWSNSRTYASGAFYQYDQPFNDVGGIDQGYAKVTVNSGSGIAAYASVIDQNTGDPTTINMKR